MLRMRLLGELSIEIDGEPVGPPASRRARALLALLALERGMHARSRLAARFWPDVLDESARTSLRSALSALRRALGPGGDRYLIAGRDEVGLADDELVWTDVAEFDRCVREDRPEDALELCRGELLAGLDDDWAYERRDEHRERVADVLAQLATRAEQNQDLSAAIGFTRRQAALDPLAEEPQRDLMRRLAEAGDRGAAIRVYERLAQRLRAELRIAPSLQTRELADALRRGGEAAAPTPIAAAGAAVEVVATPPAAPAAQEPGPAVVTLLFTDLVGSTELLDALGDDEAERLRRMHFGLLRDVAGAHSGQEVKNLGDGLMVAFSSAVNAVSCAVGIQQAVYRHNARQGDDRLKVRVGLNVGEPIRDEEDYFGTPVVVAKRLCDRAEGGQILASDLLRALIGSRGSFGFRSLGSMALKGISEPLPTVQIEWEPAPERRIALPRALVLEDAAPLVGRDRELERLGESWEDARAGRRRVALLVGDPGIGKTRLAAEFCRTAHEEGALVLLGRCYEESLVPYQAIVEALRHYVSEAPLDELRLHVGSHRATLARLVPELDEQSPSADGGFEVSEREQFVLLDAVASLLRAVAEEQPLILVLDDLQWADAPTLLLVRHLVRATEDAPLLILGTYRETEVDQSHPLAQTLAELRRARALETLAIRGLGEEDVAVLISSRAGLKPPATVARSIASRTEGNPFFVEEVLRDVAAEEDWSEALQSVGVPESVKDLLLRRMRRLDDGCRRLLTIAAIAGREFSLEVVEAVAGTNGEEVAELLEQAIEAHIIRELAGSIGQYSFAHALIRETIYEQLSTTRRAQLHRQIGEAIEAGLEEQAPGQASTLAYHFSAAGDVAKAYEYHSLAAVGASRVYATELALSHYSAALEAGEKLGLDPDREPALRRLLLQRGRMRCRTGDWERASVDLDAALASARAAGDRAIEMETLNELGIVQMGLDLGAAASLHEAALGIAEELGDAVAQANALDRLAVISSNVLEFSRGLELGERALELARATEDANVIARAIDSIKLAVWQLGDLARLKELTAELEPIWRERGELWYLQFALLEAAFVPIGEARWDEAAERLAEAAAINRRVRDRAAEVLIDDGFCWLHRSRGAYEEALGAGRRAMAHAAATSVWEGWAAATLGTALLELGAADAAAEVLERGLASAERAGSANQTTRSLGQLAWARSLQGDEREARVLAARATELLEQVRTPPGGAFLFGAHAYAAVARVHLASGEAERGEALILPLLRAAERSGWKEVAAVTELVLGLCLESRGELSRAAATLGRAAQVADEFGIPAPSWEAHAGLGRVLRATGRPDVADKHVASAAATVGRVAADLKSQDLRDQLRARAKL